MTVSYNAIDGQLYVFAVAEIRCKSGFGSSPRLRARVSASCQLVVLFAGYDVIMSVLLGLDKVSGTLHISTAMPAVGGALDPRRIHLVVGVRYTFPLLYRMQG